MYLKDPIPPPTSDVLEPHGNPWHPFNRSLEYEFAHYQFVRLRSSADNVQRGLDIWKATVTECQTDNDKHRVPWKTPKDMYETIDSISVGGVGWTTHELSYDGPQPTGVVPLWMQESYELNVRDIISVFDEQLGSKEFDGQFEYTPYEEYDQKGSRVYSDLMSGNWAFCEAVCVFTGHLFI